MSWKFWEEIVCNEDGSLNLEKVKAELHDYENLLEEVPKVYDHVSGGRISKPNTFSYEVCNAADAHYEELHAEEVAFWEEERNKAGLEAFDLGEALSKAQAACKRLRERGDKWKAEASRQRSKARCRFTGIIGPLEHKANGCCS